VHGWSLKGNQQPKCRKVKNEIYKRKKRIEEGRSRAAYSSGRSLGKVT